MEEQFQQNTVPKGPKIKPLKAKSKLEDLQKFDDILHETEVKLFGVTLESLRKDVLETEHSIARCKEDINAPSADGELRVRSRAKKSTEKADLLAKYVNKFVDVFYFQCTANKTSKALQDALSKEEKDKDTTSHQNNLGIMFQYFKHLFLLSVLYVYVLYADVGRNILKEFSEVMHVKIIIH